MTGLKEIVDPWMQTISTSVEIAGVSVIIIGGAAALLAFLYQGVGSLGWPDSFHHLRANLGRAILLGLELLVAADIIGTIAITPSFENLGILAMIVAIRTFLSFSLEVEIEGRWPWRRSGSPRDEPR